MIQWGVSVIGVDQFKQFELCVTTDDSGTDATAIYQANKVLEDLRVVRQLGPNSWAYDALIAGNARRIAP